MFQRFKCLLGKHKRDSKRVKIGADEEERSVCVGCGRAMVKEYRGARGTWRVADSPPDR